MVNFVGLNNLYTSIVIILRCEPNCHNLCKTEISSLIIFINDFSKI